MIRPIVSGLSFYFGVYLSKKSEPNLLKNSVATYIIARIPFLFLPFLNNFYYIFFSSVIYQLFYKANLPAWTEILKRNIKDENSRFDLFSTFSIFVFIESILIGILIGSFLDKSTENWKILFFISSFISISTIFFQLKLKVASPKKIEKNISGNFFSNISKILKNDKNFTSFQIGFSIGGFALMLITPALYLFLNDILKITHQEMIFARLVIMGIGFSLTSILWKKSLIKKSINSLMYYVLFGFSLYILLLAFSKYSIIFFYGAFLIYGISQAGSTLIFNLSGMIFSKDDNSILYTSTNLLFLGIRGLIAPLFGSLLCKYIDPATVLFIGLIILLYGIYIAYKSSKKPNILSVKEETL